MIDDTGAGCFPNAASSGGVDVVLSAGPGPDIEVYDTLRLGQHAPASPRGRRRVLYLDDLFSVRYDRMLAVDERGDVDINPLGEFAANVPAPLR